MGKFKTIRPSENLRISLSSDHSGDSKCLKRNSQNLAGSNKFIGKCNIFDRKKNYRLKCAPSVRASESCRPSPAPFMLPRRGGLIFSRTCKKEQKFAQLQIGRPLYLIQVHVPMSYKSSRILILLVLEA